MKWWYIAIVALVFLTWRWTRSRTPGKVMGMVPGTWLPGVYDPSALPGNPSVPGAPSTQPGQGVYPKSSATTNLGSWG